MKARTGQIFRAPGGSWAIRWRDVTGRRHQRNGFVTKAEAKAVLDEELKRARLGVLHRPDRTLRELVEAFLEQYDAAPSSADWIRTNVAAAVDRFGDRSIGMLHAQEIGAWRATLHGAKRYRAHRALRQVLEAAVRWKWIEENPATLVKNPEPPAGELHPFESWAEVDAVAVELGDRYGPLVICLVGTGLRPEEAFGAEWRDVDLEGRALTVRRAFAKGRLKDYTKTQGSTRRIPLRRRVVDALEAASRRHPLVFQAPESGYININNFRSREWKPALEAAGVAHRRIYDLRHTYATWSLAAGINIFTLARRMGTSLKMIDKTYGHLAANADDYERELLDAYDAAQEDGNGR